jgi:hypothetical protein
MFYTIPYAVTIENVTAMSVSDQHTIQQTYAISQAFCSMQVLNGWWQRCTPPANNRLTSSALRVFDTDSVSVSKLAHSAPRKHFAQISHRPVTTGLTGHTTAQVCNRVVF